MIIANRLRKGRSIRLSTNTVIGIILLLATAFIFYYFLGNWTWGDQQQTEYFCDAETTRSGQFVGNGHKFDRAETQTNKRAYSGKYSCGLKGGEGLQYGFGTNFDDVQPGEHFEVSVWTFSEGNSPGKLVASAADPNLFYKEIEEFEEVGKAGWRKLRLDITLPVEEVIDVLKIYVYSTGENVVYFDDLTIVRGKNKGPIFTSDFNPQKIQISLTEKGMTKLKRKREAAFEEGFLVTEEEDWVSGRIVEGDYQTKVKLRLKGDILDHLSGKKWSFRVKTRGEAAWNRMMTFNFQNPKTRDFLDEWVLHRLFEQEDVLTPRYEFLNLSLNNQSLGIYAMEEHFDKQLVEYKSRREGPIVKFSEDGEWEGRKREMAVTGSLKNWKHTTDFREASEIQPFKAGKTLKSETLSRQFELAKNLMQAYKSGELNARDIFDLELMARYFAIIDIMGAHHSIYWTNQRFYYNPVNSKLEPVGFDGFSNSESWVRTFIGWQMFHPESANYEFYVKLFQDADFMEKYVANLIRLSDPAYLNEFFKELKPEITARQEFLREEFTDYQFDKKRFLDRAKEIHTIILPYNNVSLKCFKDPNQKGTYDVVNYHGLPLTVIGFGRNLDDLVKIKAQTLFAHKMGRVPLFEQIQSEMDNARYIFFKPLGADTVFSSEIITWARPQVFSVNTAIFDDLEITSNALYAVRDSLIRFRAGQHQSNRDIIIPEGYRVEFEPGTQIDLVQGAKFISRSAVYMFGNEETPIRIFSSDQSAKGFTVLEAEETSELRFVEFDHLNTLIHQGWNLTGAVTFYASDVNINNCIIQNNHCEDALNIIRSEFEITNTIIQHTPFDAFDADFCSGSIRDSKIADSGNDGLDFSGSTISVVNCYLENNGDKGISVGEESTVTVKKASINNAVIALASKDRSYLKVGYVDMKNCNQGFAAYQKKPEYGPARIIVSDYTVENIKYLYTLGNQCELRLKDKQIIGEWGLSSN